MLAQPRTTTVRSGAVVGLYEFGDATGAPVIALHGVPSCGAGFAFADEPARIRGVRVIAPDRPRVGLSSPAARWTVDSYPAMLAELADSLGIERFAVWGYSGGGPYGVACAASLPDRVSAAAITAGMGQIGVWAELTDFEKTDRRYAAMARTRPHVARAILAVTARLARMSPKSAVKSFGRELSESDRRVLAEYGTPAEAMALFTQAFLRGARGVVDDYAAIGGSWGVDFASVRVPVGIFHGDADTMVPLRHSEELVKRITGAQLVVWPGEGHLGTVTHAGEILDWLSAKSGQGGI
jgi:pimeloyl-ACP methyl ester carboxylesterase